MTLREFGRGLFWTLIVAGLIFGAWTLMSLGGNQPGKTPAGCYDGAAQMYDCN